MEAELANAVSERLALQRVATDLEAQLESLRFTSSKEQQGLADRVADLGGQLREAKASAVKVGCGMADAWGAGRPVAGAVAGGVAPCCLLRLAFACCLSCAPRCLLTRQPACLA